MEIMKQIRSTRTESFGDDEFQITNALLLITRTRSFRFWNLRVQFEIPGTGTVRLLQSEEKRRWNTKSQLSIRVGGP